MAPSLYAIPLGTGFRFVHEPLDCSADVHLKRFVGRRDELEELTARILLSDGGAFLVTGYRGVGKSTFVNRVIQEIQTQLPALVPTLGVVRLIDVHLSVPRAMASLELMYHVLRGLYLRLSALNLLNSLDPTLRRDLELAFSRTSRTVALTTTGAIDSTIGVTLGAPLPGIPHNSSGLTLGSKRTSSNTQAIAYLAYDDKAAEHDLIDIARRLSGAGSIRHNWRDRLLQRWNGSSNRPPRLKVVFVFDELDKIEDAGEPGAAIDAVLANLKTLFTTSGIAFLFVAGKDIHDRWLEDIGRGDSVYESVFSYALYLPPLWADADPMCDPFLDNDAFRTVDSADSAGAYAAFKKFLAFTGRGIPRRVLRRFNERVRWANRTPQLVFSRDDVRQFRFFADLYDILQEDERRLVGELRDDATAGRTDRKRLGIYYLVDWILLRGIDEFTVQDAVAASRRLSRLIAPAEEAAPDLIRRLVNVLLEHSYIEIAAGPSADSTDVENPPAKSPARYRLTRKRLVEMGSLAGVVEQEAQVVSQEAKSQRFGGRYEVVSIIAHGGMSTVYLARDPMLGRDVAVKELLADPSGQPEARERFRREAEALSRLQHENIVRIYDVDSEAKPPYIVMELVEGLRLTDLIASDVLKTESEILRIAHEVVGALVFIHQRGILWRDAKPSNIMITPQGRVVLLDFGISRISDTDDSEAGMVLGTPDYSSPEQLRGEVVDARSDIYCVGIVLYQMASGRLPFPSDGTLATAFRRIDLFADPLNAPHVSEELTSVILKCLQPLRQNRYESAADLLKDLPASTSRKLPTMTRELLQASAELERREDKPTAVATQDEFASSSLGTEPGERLEVDAASIIMPGGTVYPLRGEIVRIGRSHTNDIVLREPAASRFQSELALKREGWAIADLNSRNSTLLNGVPVTSSMILRDGDAISVGDTVLIFRAASGDNRDAGPRVRRSDLFHLVEEIRELASTSALDHVMELGLDRAIEIARAERGFVMLANDSGELEFAAARARGGLALPGSSFATSRKIPEEVFRTGEPSFVTDLLDGDLSSVHLGTVAIGIRNVFCMPLTARQTGEPVGVMYLDSRERGLLYSSSTREALRALAVEFAEIIRGGRLLRVQQEKLRIEQELKVAARIQQGLQPRAEHSGSFFEISVRSIPCPAIGGDFSHYSEFDASHFAFILGDVAGKGAAAALVGTFLLGALESSASAHELPGQTLAKVNKSLVSHQGESRFSTLFYGLLNASGTLAYSNAGHNPPLVVRPQRFERLEKGGPVIGLFGRAEYEDASVRLAPEDLVVVFSDGVSEALDAQGAEFGEERLVREIERTRSESTSTIADAILASQAEFSAGVPAADDVSLMVVRYHV